MSANEPRRRAELFLGRWLFLRLLGVIYFLAFVSLWSQVDGLIGSHGILPAAEFLRSIAERVGPERFWWLPTLGWWNASDWFLRLLCGGGAGLAVLLFCGVAPRLVSAALWVAYLSLGTLGQDFLSFQWDTLLLECGFLAIFFAPRQWLPDLARETPPSIVIVWLYRWLLFRLMFLSGAVKLLSRDHWWWSLRALEVHYETQPLPTWIGWYAHQLPASGQRFSVVVMFAIELAAPFLIFTGRRGRRIAAAGIAGLMLLIVATGNYCFFNLLTLALCLLLLDDDDLRPFVPRRLTPPSQSETSPTFWARVRTAGVAVLAATLLLISGAEMNARMFGWEPWPAPLQELTRLAAPFRSVNSYGLFAVMTSPRLEIEIEGSDDRVNWRTYQFRWKPGELGHAPAFVQPHQPRLDWQMWFAALGDYRQNPWFLHFLERLLQGSPPVLGLLERNPFPSAPPRYVRATLYEYHFTDWATRRATGGWWRREKKGPYCPEASLR